VSVPYPGTGKTRSQGDDHLAGLASRYLEQNLAHRIGWQDVVAHLERQHGKTHAQAQRGTLFAVLDLEHSGAIAHEVTTAARYRRPLPTDPPSALLEVVAEAVIALGWPTPAGKRSRTVQHTFVELGGRYRHCDVYWAMHERLKDRELECHLQHWSLRGEQAIIASKLADPTLPIAERFELERQVEADLVADYVESLDHRVEVEYRLPSTRRVDVYDRHRRLVIEAKATRDGLVSAIGQVARYRWELNRDVIVVDRGAVLLGTQPSDDDLAFVATLYLELDVIWRDGEAFRHEVLT